MIANARLLEGQHQGRLHYHVMIGMQAATSSGVPPCVLCARGLYHGYLPNSNHCHRKRSDASSDAADIYEGFIDDEFDSDNPQRARFLEPDMVADWEASAAALRDGTSVYEPLPMRGWYIEIASCYETDCDHTDD